MSKKKVKGKSIFKRTCPSTEKIYRASMIERCFFFLILGSRVFNYPV